MADDKKRDWMDILDLASKLLIPVVLTLGGFWYSSRQAEDEANRRNLDRDLGYVKMLASTNENEKKLGMGIIGVFSRAHHFSPDLAAVLAVFANGPEDDPLTQAANRILKNQQQTNTVAASSAASTAKVEVFIQIAKPEQRADAEALQVALRKAEFATPGIEVVTGGVATVHTYVRFFSATGAREASRVNEVMGKLGYTSAVQDFSAYTPSPLSSIEVWIGKNQGPLPAPPGS